MAEFEFATKQRVEARDVTDLLANLPAQDGFLWLSVPHTTGALFLSETDPDLLADFGMVAQRLLAPYEPFRHRKNDNPNAAAHIVSALFGSQLVLPIVGGRLALGTHQRIVFLELDGPRTRTLQVVALREASAAVGS